MPSPMATHEMTPRARVVNSFLCEFKSFLLAISLASHECAPSQEVSLCCLLPKCKFKNYPSPGQTPLYSQISNYSTSGCRKSNHLGRHRQGSRYCVFYCDRGSLCPLWPHGSVTLADGCHTDGCALKFFILASKGAAVKRTRGSRDVRSRDLGRGLKC